MTWTPSCLTCGTTFPSAKSTDAWSFTSDLYNSLASSNEPVSDADATALRDDVRPQLTQGILAVEHDLAGLESTMVFLLSEKIRLEAEMDRIQSMISRTSGLLSAMQRFPVEILSHIFQLCCDDHDSHLFDTSRGSWALSRVCRRWRSIVVSLPSLWTFINLQEEPPQVTVGWRTLLNIAIERTRGHPISVVFKGQDDDDLYSLPDRVLESQWLLSIMEYSSRWESATLSIVDEDLVWDLCQINAPLPLPMLHTLHLKLSTRFSDGSWQMMLFAEAIQLRHLKLDSNSDVVIPAGKLATLWVHAYSCEQAISHAHQILCRAVQLESLRVDYQEICPADFETGPLPAIVNSPVRRLHLRPSCCNPGAGYRFTASNLEVLHISGFRENHECLLEFLGRSGGQLKELKITCLHFSDLAEVLLAILRLAPNLRQVSLEVDSYFALNRRWMDKEYERFVHAMDKGVIEGFPHLRSFTVDYPPVGQYRIV